MQKIVFYLSYIPIKLFGKYANAKKSLVFLFNLHKRILTLISDRASDYEGGVHPKHRLMQYHRFFTERLSNNEKVLDIGSGRGFLANEMARTGARVVGIELSKKNLDQSKRLYQAPNLRFILGDAWKDLPKEKFDTIVMSNVLEHIDERIKFVQVVQNQVSPKRWLLRVPCFDRDWTIALAQELGLDSRLDETHFTEFTTESFQREMSEAGLKAVYFERRWGEIWAELVPNK
ncbi:MAG: class I SAM-dependent methyltransferase [Patescibacteria group bacterium]